MEKDTLGKSRERDLGGDNSFFLFCQKIIIISKNCQECYKFRMPRSENARNSSKQHDQRKILTFVQNGGMLELKSYLKRHKSTDINFRLKDSMNR